MAIGTFNPSFDGQTLRSGVTEDFSTIRAAAGNATNTDTTQVVHLHSTTDVNVFSYNYRYVANFNTSFFGTVAPAVSITSATFDVYVRSHLDNNGMGSVALVAPTPASKSAIANADYNIANWPATRMAPDLAISGLTDSARNVWTLNSNGITNINKTGTSTFGLIFTNDVDNGGATWSSDNDSLVQADFSVGTFLPQLIVTYTLGGNTTGLQAKYW